jgi:four helix bundle protein
MKNKEFAKQLEARTREFAVRIIRLSTNLPNTPEAKAIKYQLTKSATSVGANYREANRARSRPDFKNKVKICESEASETVYWLTIISELEWITKPFIQPILSEAKQLLAIFTSIGKRL